MPAPVLSPEASRERQYVDWFLWAREQGLDDQRCHGAASAAVKARMRGQDAVQAAVNGARKAKQQHIHPKAYQRELCNWYVWAISRQAMPDEALSIARAAAISVARGMVHTQALDVALAYERGDQSVRLGLPLWRRALRDPGTWLSGFALLLLVLALVGGYRLPVGILSLLMLVAPVRASRFVGRTTPMIALAALINIFVLVAIALNIKL